MPNPPRGSNFLTVTVYFTTFMQLNSQPKVSKTAALNYQSSFVQLKLGCASSLEDGEVSRRKYRGDNRGHENEI